jgi:VanZ family protein
MGWLNWGGFVAVALALLLGCLLPNRWLPARLPNDKLLHFAGFGVLSLLALRLAGDRVEGALWLLAVLLGSWLIECLQQLVPDRRFCWRDMAANAAGIASAGLIALTYAAL